MDAGWGMPDGDRLPLRRTHGVADQLPSRWLFPGARAGRPVSPHALTRRLRAIGIEPRHMRNNARAQLAAEIPAAMLGEIIGVAPHTADRWAAVASGKWTAYASDRFGARETSARRDP